MDILKKIEQNELLGKVGDIAQLAVLNVFKTGGAAGASFKNVLHGTWLGHPLHPLLTDIPIGAWSAAAMLDAFELMGSKRFRSGADATIALGVAGALGAAITGIADWTGTSQKEQKVGTMHAILNIAATKLYVGSLILRRKEKTRKIGIVFSMLGYAVMSAAAYLGGHLVFAKQVGVDHTATAVEYPEDYVAVLPEKDLAEGKMKCVKAGDVPILLLKKEKKIYAIANTCSHLGGPLVEGELLADICAVRCPWHDSEFSFKDGKVINGPASEPQPSFDVRINDGQIEVKLSHN